MAAAQAKRANDKVVGTLSACCSVPRLLPWLLFLELEGWPKKKAEKFHLNQNKGVFMQLCAVNYDPTASVSHVYAAASQMLLSLF